MFIRPAVIATLCLLSSPRLSAQNWNLVNPARECLFGVDVNFFANPEGLRIDSISTSGSDTVYWNYRQVYAVDAGSPCSGTAAVDSNDFGRYIVKKPGGEYWATIRNGLIVKIQTLAPAGSSWPVLTFADGNYLKGTVTAVDTLTVLGAVDSVKYISLQYTNGSNNQPIASGFNGREMIISKNHGWVRNYRLFDFPDQFPIQLDLAGQSGPQAGLRNFNAQEAWNFLPGDTLHTYRETNVFSWQMIMYAEQQEMAVLYRGNSVTGDTVTYVFHYRGAHQTYNTSTMQMDPWIPYNYLDTVVMDFTSPEMQSLSLMPNEWVSPDVFLYNVSGFLSDLEYDGRNQKGLGNVEVVYNSGTGCVERTGNQVYPMWQFIIEGLGGVYYHHVVVQIEEEHYYPVWYHKGNEVWGTPFDIDLISSAESTADEMALSFFPNPMNESATLRWDAQQARNLHLTLMSLSGQVIGCYETTGTGEWTLRREQVPAAGLYFLTAQDESGRIQTIKFSVQ